MSNSIDSMQFERQPYGNWLATNRPPKGMDATYWWVKQEIGGKVWIELFAWMHNFNYGAGAFTDFWMNSPKSSDIVAIMPVARPT